MHYRTFFTIKPNSLGERLSFCEANIKDLNEWVTTLSIMQLGDTSKALFTAILELNELKCSETLRFDLIQTLPSHH